MKKRPIDIKNILGMLSFCFAFFQYTWFMIFISFNLS